MKLTKDVGLLASLLFFCGASQAQASSDDVQEDIAKAYEMSIFTEDGGQSGGLPLAYPGDSYGYTFVLNDEYSQDPTKYIKAAIVGIHIIDEDWQADRGDLAPEWGRILIDNQPQRWIKPAHLTAYDYHQGEEPQLSTTMEIQSEYEVSTYANGVPPYIFDVTDQVEKNRRLKVDVINVNQGGTTEYRRPFGDFTVLRIGLRVIWATR
jgi:hypothetical protein